MGAEVDIVLCEQVLNNIYAAPGCCLTNGLANAAIFDFSMNSRNADKQQAEWKSGDVRDRSEIETGSVDIAFDKGTLDAMSYGSPWDPPEDVVENSGKYMNKVQRVLKDDGLFLYVTYRQPHFVKPILNRAKEWDLNVETMGNGDSFQYLGFVLKKHLKASS